MDRTMALVKCVLLGIETLALRSQIDAHIKYLRHRYKDACDALNHLETRGWH
jgi:hypothetical protein